VNRLLAACFAAAGLWTGALGIGGTDEHGGLAVDLDARQIERILKLSPLPAPPPDPTNRVADDPRAVHFGQFLFFDKRLSGNGEIACATCHDPAKGFADGRQLGRGVADLARHSPTLYDVAFNRWFFWDGRTDSLWAQAVQPIENPSEMGGDRWRIARLILEDTELARAYQEIFGPLPDEVFRALSKQTAGAEPPDGGDGGEAREGADMADRAHGGHGAQGAEKETATITCCGDADAERVRSARNQRQRRKGA